MRGSTGSAVALAAIARNFAVFMRLLSKSLWWSYAGCAGFWGQVLYCSKRNASLLSPFPIVLLRFIILHKMFHPALVRRAMKGAPGFCMICWF